MSDIITGYFATCPFTSTLPRPVQCAGSFVLDGATDPSEQAGDVLSVRRLVDASANAFFRVKLSKRLALTALSTIIIGSVRGTAVGDEPGYNIIPMTADPATTRDDTAEFDVVILDAGLPVDTAGFWFQFHIDAATALNGIVEAA